MIKKSSIDRLQQAIKLYIFLINLHSNTDIDSKCRIFLTVHSFKNICKIMLYFILFKKKAYNFLLKFFDKRK